MLPDQLPLAVGSAKLASASDADFHAFTQGTAGPVAPKSRLSS